MKKEKLEELIEKKHDVSLKIVKCKEKRKDSEVEISRLHFLHQKNIKDILIQIDVDINIDKMINKIELLSKNITKNIIIIRDSSKEIRGLEKQYQELDKKYLKL